MPRKLGEEPLLDPLVEEGEVLLPLLQQGLEGELEQPLRQGRIVREVGEGDLRLDHPELRQVPAGVGVLGPERRPEGVDLGERQAVGLDVELPRHGEERLAAEEVLAEIHLPPRRARQVGEVERRHPEQRARPFRVGRGDDRRVDPEKAVVVEEPVDRLRQGVAHPRRRRDHVGARPQVRHVAQELHRVRLGLDRIGVGVLDPADHLDRARLHLERLPLGRRRHDRPGRLHRAAGRELLHLVGVVG